MSSKFRLRDDYAARAVVYDCLIRCQLLLLHIGPMTLQHEVILHIQITVVRII